MNGKYDTIAAAIHITDRLNNLAGHRIEFLYFSKFTFLKSACGVSIFSVIVRRVAVHMEVRKGEDHKYKHT